MGLLQAAYQTYDTLDRIFGAGVAHENMKLLAPPSHSFQNASIEITINLFGEFISAEQLDKKDAETLIPVTERSANRTNKFSPHPLAEQIGVLSGENSEKTEQYLELLSRWSNSRYTHEKARAVLQYVKKRTVLADLQNAGIVKPPDKALIRWRVIPSDIPECHKDIGLMTCYENFYKSYQTKSASFCMISGESAVAAESHPKGTIKSVFNAKLISANDSSGFMYRGRFTGDSEALSIGYDASQKAHSALRFLIANYGVSIGERTFLCWNPKGKKIPVINYDDSCEEIVPDFDDEIDFESYKERLHDSLWGVNDNLKLAPEDSVIIASFQAATTGRLSATYYNEMSGRDFLKRIENWYGSLCVKNSYGRYQIPSLLRIIKCAYGTNRDKSIDIDSGILGERIGQLFHCVVDAQPIPENTVRAIADKCSRLYLYEEDGKIRNKTYLLTTAYAVIRKYHNDQLKREEWKLALDEKNVNRSYLFGRLLAIAEKVERDTYDRNETREPNAMRMQSVFSQRPLYAWRIMEENLKPYYARLSAGTRTYYKNLVQQIADNLSSSGEDLNRKLEDVYLLGYYHQRTALYTKKDAGSKINEQENESEE